ncbi:MAG: sigma-70 family RNA polymerase sigma factor [Verrucomicrobiota bacterium]
MTPSDLELLQRFTRDCAQDAFTELVHRHVSLVYSAALRQVRSPQLAEEVTQSVFADLARVAATPSSPFGKGGSDASSPRSAGDAPSQINLTAWLFTVTRRTAVDVIRKEARRQLREQLAYEMNITNAPDASWPHIEPLLDEAVAELDDTDRAAVLLRYFENQSLRAVGQQLGVSDDAAQKRVSRAVERLREFFAKRGVTVGAGGLVVVISANAVQAAPVGLAVTISAAALAGTAATTSTLIAATTKTIAMTTLQKTLVTATVAVLAGAGIYEARQAAHLRDQVESLQQQQAPLAEQIQQLQGELESSSNRVEGLVEELASARKNSAELLKLRGEVTLLRREVKAAKANAANNQAMTDVAPTRAATNQSANSDHPKETWNYAGYATPENALQTWTWAMSKNDQQTMLNSLTPESRKQWEQLFASQPEAGVGMKGLGKIAGYKVVDTGYTSESEAWVAISMTETKPTTTTPPVMKMLLKKIGAEWRVSGPSQN